jgi:hypothetical protein
VVNRSRQAFASYAAAMALVSWSSSMVVIVFGAWNVGCVLHTRGVSRQVVLPLDIRTVGVKCTGFVGEQLV